MSSFALSPRQILQHQAEMKNLREVEATIDPDWPLLGDFLGPWVVKVQSHLHATFQLSRDYILTKVRNIWLALFETSGHDPCIS